MLEVVKILITARIESVEVAVLWSESYSRRAVELTLHLLRRRR